MMRGNFSARKLAVALAVICALAFSRTASADFAAGVAAYDGGDYEAALEAFSGAAIAGEVEAQVALANLYHFGEGVARNAEIAANWYSAAAHLGDATAQANLGQFHAEGIGVVRDAVVAYVWFVRASAQGHAWASERAEELDGSLNDGQRATARQKLREPLTTVASGSAEVVDGHTLQIAHQVFRLNGINAPALGFLCPLRGTLRDCGLISASALKDLTAGATVICRRLGRYNAEGQMIAHCEVDGYDLSEGMVYTGWAEANTQQVGRYVTLEAEARAKPRGMWRTE